MELTFLGTRGETGVRSRRHRWHSSLLVKHGGSRIVIDCGGDWRGRLGAVAPTAIMLTHAHPDHSYGLADGAPCPVYATKETLDLLRHFPVLDWREIRLKKSTVVDGILFEAYPVQHSIRVPAIGYRVSAEGRCFFYVPDVADLPAPRRALRKVDLYIGDGASMFRSMVRRKNAVSIGHAPITVQLGWCQMADVHCAVFTHCGSKIVRSDARQVQQEIRRLGQAYGVEARVAVDAEELRL